MDANELAPYLDAAEGDALRKAPGKPGALLLWLNIRLGELRESYVRRSPG